MTERTITTPRLLLRAFKLEDARALFTYRSLPEVTEFQQWRPRRLSEVKAFLERDAATPEGTPDSWKQMAVCLLGGPLIGDIGIHWLGDAQAEIGYTVAPAYQGHGYAYEAVTAVLHGLFSQGLHRVSARVDPDNRRSVRLLQRVGMREEGRFIKSCWFQGRWCDECVYALLREEWKRPPEENDG